MKKLFALLCAATLLFAFAACGETTKDDEELKIGGYDAVRLEDGVFYVNVAQLESDPGDNPSALECAKIVLATLKKIEFQTEAGDSTHISLMGIDDDEGEDRYAYAMGMGKDYLTGNDFVQVYTLWVNYAGDVFAFMGGEMFAFSEESNGWEPIDGREDLIPLDEDQAMYIVSELLGVQLDEGLTLVAKGEDEVNGQHAFLFDLGESTDEKFTAEEHYAVTDDGEVWLLDVLANEWQPAAAG